MGELLREALRSPRDLALMLGVLLVAMVVTSPLPTYLWGPATLRPTSDGRPFVTDEGHHLLDCAVPDGDLDTLATALKTTLGVVEHGLFLTQADEVLLGHPGGRVQVLHR